MKKLFLVFLIGLFFRVIPYSVPLSLNWDEVSHAYTSWLLLNSGRDQWGEIFPSLSFRAYGDYPTTLNVYLTTSIFSIFGTNDSTARMPHVMYGQMFILLVYILVTTVTKSKNSGLVASLITAIEPWTVFPSRGIFQSNIALLIFTLGLTLFIRRKYIFSIIIFLISLFSYHTCRIVMPFFSFMFLFKRKYTYFLIIFICSLLVLLNPESQARNRWVGLLNPDRIYSIEFNRNSSTLPSLLPRLIYNRPVYLVRTIIENTVDYLSPVFLLTKGGTQTQFSVPGFGVFSIFTYAVSMLGLIYCVRNNKLIIAGILICLLPAILTIDRFAVLRSTLSIPFWLIFSGYGYLILKRNKLTVGILTVLGIVWIGLYYHNLIFVYPVKYSSDWQYGYKEMVGYVNENIDKYENILITKKKGEPHEFYWWYSRTPQFELTDSKNISWDFHDNWYWVNRFKNIHFIDDWKIKDTSKLEEYSGTTLVVSGPENIPEGKIVSQINYPDGKVNFIFVEL